MVQQSGVIIHATVLKVESDRDARSRLLYTDVTVHVQENFYGSYDSLYTFRQFGGKHQGKVYYPSKMVQYKVGQELILMLYPKSKMGFQSPVGAEQGVFTVTTDAKGVKNAGNAILNRTLFRGVKQTKILNKLSSVQRQPGEGIPLKDFSQAIHSLVAIYKK
jgi:hypothetical protein